MGQGVDAMPGVAGEWCFLCTGGAAGWAGFVSLLFFIAGASAEGV